ncbi:3-oxo-5-alpha-steroid 4-dehydrogenase-domain-containing protein [Hyaloraphidium curvatum]|nr:3-oxo-5-alpha-steroid 4-dehydrogenase-domain-containing protein [Hyaloraphidium curvatum]
MLLAHFGKRVFETLFVHKYSGNGDLPTSAVIGINYALQALLINSQQAQVADSLRLAWAFRVGLGLFAVGELGNLYHHYLLSTLRSKGGEKKYSVPRGGLFSLVVAPHYLFELVAWLGIAVVAQQTNAWLVLACMTSYLAGRSTATLDWYKKNVQGFPTDRKRLVPFLF